MTSDTATPTSAKVRKFPCHKCGADLVWSPGLSRMSCPYCGHVEEIPQTVEAVIERPIEEALNAPKDLGWGMERKVFHCTRCGASSTFEAGQAAGACAFCGTPAVVEAPPDQDMVRPEGALPFRIDRKDAVGRFRTWVSSLWFRPNDLKSVSAISRMQGVYVPFWIFDALTHSAWAADAGYYYYVAVQAVQGGRTVTRQERRTRWEPASGTLEKFFDDLPVIASRGLQRVLSEAIEPFPTNELRPYDKGYLSGFIAEEYGIAIKDALETAHQRMDAAIRSECASRVPGDTHRNLQVRTRYSEVAYKNALLPIWIAAYSYQGKTFQYIVNGATGKATGTAPYSLPKILMAVAAIIAVILLVIITKG